MEEYVTISLERYEFMRDLVKAKENVIKLQDKVVEDLNNQIDCWRKSILERSLMKTFLKEYSLEELLDYGSKTFPIINEDDLLERGFTKEEIINFIKEEYEKSKGASE